jgi:signal peptidase
VNSEASRKSAWGGFFAALAAVLLVAVLALAVAVGGVPLIVNGQVLNVNGDTMWPAFSRGDVIIIRPVDDPAQIQAGKIISYRTGADATVVTRRVVDERLDGSQRRLVTRGDNDPPSVTDEVAENQIVGVYMYRIPKLGYAVTWAGQHGLVVIVIGSAAVVAVAAVLLLIARRRAGAARPEPGPGRAGADAPDRPGGDSGRVAGARDTAPERWSDGRDGGPSPAARWPEARDGESPGAGVGWPDFRDAAGPSPASPQLSDAAAPASHRSSPWAGRREGESPSAGVGWPDFRDAGPSPASPQLPDAAAPASHRSSPSVGEQRQLAPDQPPASGGPVTGGLPALGGAGSVTGPDGIGGIPGAGSVTGGGGIGPNAESGPVRRPSGFKRASLAGDGEPRPRPVPWRPGPAPTAERAPGRGRADVPSWDDVATSGPRAPARSIERMVTTRPDTLAKPAAFVPTGPAMEGQPTGELPTRRPRRIGPVPSVADRIPRAQIPAQPATGAHPVVDAGAPRRSHPIAARIPRAQTPPMPTRELPAVHIERAMPFTSAPPPRTSANRVPAGPPSAAFAPVPRARAQAPLSPESTFDLLKQQAAQVMQESGELRLARSRPRVISRAGAPATPPGPDRPWLDALDSRRFDPR